MSDLRREIHQARPFLNDQEEAFLALQRTAGLHHQALAAFLKPYAVTPTQYNALRILRGAHPDAMSCTEIGQRMVNPVPDVTRLMNRLVEHELVERQRDGVDRRIVRIGITAAGLALLEAIDEPLGDWIDGVLEPLSARQTTRLIRILGALRTTA